jgi:hypothetical protein
MYIELCDHGAAVDALTDALLDAEDTVRRENSESAQEWVKRIQEQLDLFKREQIDAARTGAKAA